MKKSICLLLIILLLFQTQSAMLWAQTILTAQVTKIIDSEITIDQGSGKGLKAGAEGVAYYMQPVAGRPVRVAVALVRVISVTPSTARLAIVESTAEVQDGYLVDLSVELRPGVPVTGPQAKKGSKWWIWLIVAAAGGGIAAAAAGGGGGGGGGTITPPSTKGTISIDLPAN